MVKIHRSCKQNMKKEKLKKIYQWRKLTFDINAEADKRCIYKNKLEEILDELPSENWLEEQEKYIQKLPQNYIEIIKNYTKYPYYSIINEYLRNGGMNRIIAGNIDSMLFDKSLLTNFNSVDDFIKDYCHKLHKIIDCSPPVDRDFIVYRGQRTKIPDKYLKNADKIYRIKGMYSTSILTSVTDTFTSVGYDHHLFKIIVPAGTKCLWVAPVSGNYGEAEILIDHGTILKFLDLRIIDKIERTTFSIVNYSNDEYEEKR